MYMQIIVRLYAKLVVYIRLSNRLTHVWCSGTVCRRHSSVLRLLSQHGVASIRMGDHTTLAVLLCLHKYATHKSTWKANDQNCQILFKPIDQ